MMEKKKLIIGILVLFLLLSINGKLICDDENDENVLVSGKYFYTDENNQLKIRAKKLPKKYEIDGVPCFTNATKWCNPTSLSMILEYWRRQIKPRPYKKKTILPLYIGRMIDKQEEGSGATAIIKYAKSFGLFGEAYIDSSPEFSKLKAIIASNYPVIVYQEYSYRAGSGHARVVVGYSDKRKYFKIHDPNWGASIMSYKEFKQLWLFYNNSFILIGPKKK